MSDRTKIAAIFGVAALALGGGLYYFFRVYQPKQERGKAAVEVEAWEQRVMDAQRCLLGDKPASARPGEALAVRELSPDPWDRSACTKLVGKLSRGLAEDTGLMTVEHAWMTVDRAAGKVATAFAMHVSPEEESPSKRGTSALADALDELAKARAELRAAAGMGEATPLGPTALPSLEIVPVKAGADRVSLLTGWLLPSAGGTIGYGRIKNQGEVQLTFQAGAAPKAQKLPAGALRAVPDGTWGAAGLSKEVAIGRIDERGAFTDMTSFPVTFGAKVVIASGAFDNGIVVYASSNAVTIARAQQGPFAAEKPFEVGRIAFAIDPGGRSLVAWTEMTGDEIVRGFIAADGAPVRVQGLGQGDLTTGACLTRTHGWLRGYDQLVAFDDKAATPHALPEHELLGCSADAALLHRFDSTHYAVCSDACRGVDFPGTRASAVAAVAGGKVVAFAARGHVLGVYAEGKPAVFYALEKPFTPTFAYASGTGVDVVGEDADGIGIAHLTP